MTTDTELRALEQAAAAFRQYETHHRAKGADEKAERNRALAEMCESALSSLSKEKAELERRLAESDVVLEIARLLCEAAVPTHEMIGELRKAGRRLHASRQSGG